MKEQIGQLQTEEVKVRWSKFLSRKFIMALMAVILPIINATYGNPLALNELIISVSALVSFIVVEGAVDYKNAKAPPLSIQDAETFLDDTK